ncbi:hypothetical protein ACHAW5_002462 [Stephanodiscus triporus]|uniref:RING-type domain-containing protein n=1 Tax=Stephanodiscus triporus TaxID=2934178 RepID=A0ABD3MX90_9STRA
MPDRIVPFHHPATAFATGGAALDGRLLTSLFDDAGADASPQHGSPSSGQQSSSSSYADPSSSYPSSSYNSSTVPPRAEVQAQAVEGDYRNVDEERDRKQTIEMTVFFLVFMVVYVGFCSFYLRKKRGLRAVILDESSEAAARARTNPSIHAKLKARMANIKQALYVRVIVDDDEGIEEEGGGGMEDHPDGGGEDDARGATADRAASAPAAVGAVPTPLAERRIVTIVEEEEDHVEGDGGGGIAPPRPRASSEGAAGAPTTASTAEEDDRRPRSSDLSSSPRDPPRLSLSSSSSKRYTDALNCGGRRSHYSDALNCGTAACSGNHAIGGGGGGVPRASRPSPEAHSVPISTIISTYGEECNICLGAFQVGDHAAWSTTRRGEDDAACGHVFHEECITRWLLVRDRCPICRESYFPTDSSTGTIVAATDDRAGVDDGPDLERGEVGDDVSPDVEIRSTPLFRRMIDRFGPAP